jgi:UDP:flavonoid glycosyltransferase YjiC (YdhE family)
MRVAVVAGPDPGHVFPAAGLALRLRAAGHSATVYTGQRWIARLRADGLDAAELPGIVSGPDDPDTDWGFRLHGRAATMAPMLVDRLRANRPDLIVADTLTAAGGLAAELLGLPWVELVPHPLQLASIALPPPGSGLAPGRTPIGRARDAALRRLHDRSVQLGRQQRAAARAAIGLPAADPGPAYRLIATLPALEPARPDWPARTEVVGPLHWEPATGELAPPPGSGPLILVSPPTAVSGRAGLVAAVLAAAARLRTTGGHGGSGPDDRPAGSATARGDGGGADGHWGDGRGADGGVDGRGAASRGGDGRGGDGRGGDGRGGDGRGADGGGGGGSHNAPRVVVTVLAPYPEAVPAWAVVGPGRQAPLLAAAAVVIAGGGHGMLSKALAAGVPVVLVPGGGDQRDLARRVARLGAGVAVERAATPRRLAAALARTLTDPAYRTSARAVAASASMVTDPVRLCAHAVSERAEGSW